VSHMPDNQPPTPDAFKFKPGGDIREMFKQAPAVNKSYDASGKEIPSMGNLSVNDRHMDLETSDQKADRTQKQPDNVPGRFFVDFKCIDCDMCREVAPNNFTRSEKELTSFVYRQPSSPEEETFCMEAIAACPVHAIGRDGDQEGAKVKDADHQESPLKGKVLSGH
jgi:ferredoxin